MKIIKLSMLFVMLTAWSNVIFAACGLVPTIEVRNMGYSKIQGKYDDVTLYCPKGQLTVSGKGFEMQTGMSDPSKQVGVKADQLLDDGKSGVCWLSGQRNGQQIKLLSFKASYNCKNKSESDWGKVSIVGRVDYLNNQVCPEKMFVCLRSQGPGLMIAVGADAMQRNPADIQSCLCPVTEY